jgi:bifunctional DNA-binding transcriptional regulator/antitoxin component of YhaV-PrlF toxin-antitoxin module
MKAVSDKAGRIVIPASVCARAGLTPGTEAEILVDDDPVRLVRKVPGPKLVRQGRRLVALPKVRAQELPAIDLAALVEAERSRRPG